MKFLIASDLHGSAYYTELLLRRVSDERADRIILLGDLLYHGPRNDLPRDYAPKQVIDMLASVKDRLLCVRGNCDGEVDQMVLPFPILAEYALLCEKDYLIYLTHGHHANEHTLPPLTAGDVLLYGHTHVPMCRKSAGIICMNPGSVSIPKENSPHSYMTLENGLFVWHNLETGTEYRRYLMGESLPESSLA